MTIQILDGWSELDPHEYPAGKPAYQEWSFIGQVILAKILKTLGNLEVTLIRSDTRRWNSNVSADVNIGQELGMDTAYQWRNMFLPLNNWSKYSK